SAASTECCRPGSCPFTRNSCPGAGPMTDQQEDPTAALKRLRERIDAIDAQIQTLISERARCAQEIGTVKGLGKTAESSRPERGAQVRRGVIARNKGPLRDDEMVRLFRELMSACLAQEEPLKVAYLGP